jgi:hypothetical protein
MKSFKTFNYLLTRGFVGLCITGLLRGYTESCCDVPHNSVSLDKKEQERRMASSGMLCRVVLTRATRRKISEDAILHSHRRENLKSYVGGCGLFWVPTSNLTEQIPVNIHLLCCAFT